MTTMSFAGDEYGKRALDFVERLQRLTKYDEICRAVIAEMEWYGFGCVSTFSFPAPGQDVRDSIWFNNRPQEWSERYVEKNQLVHDPVIKELRTNLHPYSWSDIRQRGLAKAERRILDEGAEFDAKDGFIVPIVTLSGATSLFSPCGRAPDLSQRARAAIEMVGIYSYHALKRALLEEKRTDATHTPLTDREREVMQWVASGKTDDEIGEILSIATSTVTTHVEASKRKLDAFRRTYAVVQAIRFGEISL